LKKRSALIATQQLRAGDWAILAAAAAVLIAGAMRYAHQPSFWLDEAFVAVSLRNPSPRIIFARLEYSQYFPRLYLSCIALLRQTAGYDIWVLRLLPFLSFVIATLFWARVLAKRTGGILAVSLLAGGLLLGAGFWLDQANQLKQYTFDVMLALIPFLVSDRFFDEALTEGKRKAALVLLTAPLVLSYTYPLILGARVLGWYVNRVREGRWHLSIPAVSLLAGLALLGLVGIWAMDYRFNLERAAYIRYWDSCILGAQHSFSSTLRLLAKFLWGWHGQMPLMTAFVAPLQVLGVYRVLNGRKNPAVSENDAAWGSRSFGSLFLLGGVILASALFYFPICAGRVVLFVQIHTQILVIEGALWILGHAKHRAGAAAILVFSGIAIVYGGRNYGRFVHAEPAENLRPVLSLIARDTANTVWVHPCSVAQVRALPEPLPVEQVVFGSETETPRPGARVWILWSHMGQDKCVRQLERVRSQAKTWEIVYKGPDCGLALAQF
jgi:hypothetical protein